MRCIQLIVAEHKNVGNLWNFRMSAIFGILHTSGKLVDVSELELMNGALALHGPDSGGLWSNASIGLGQLQMRFTPEDCFEQQPLVSSEGLRVLVTDARIDNRPELAKQLELSASETRHMPDSLFIMKAYEKWGVECPAYLTGSFAGALWDDREQQLLLFRSHLGERPLYYYRTSDYIIFSSMPKGLFAHPQIQRRINEEYLADYMTNAPKEAGSTLYQNIERLPQAHCLLIQGDRIRLHRYWQPDFSRECKFSRNEDYVDATRELLDRVIADHSRSITPVGVMMSGGLDSAAVAALAAIQAKKSGRRVATFTEVPRPGFDEAIIGGRYADETPFVQAIGNMYENIDLNLIRTDGRFFLDDAVPFFEMAEMPFRNANNRVWMEALYREAQKQNIRVLLTGVPGNLTVSWDGRGLLPAMIKSGAFLNAWHEAGLMQKYTPTTSQLKTYVGHGVMPLLPALLQQCIRGVYHRRRQNNSEPPWLPFSAVHPQFTKVHRVLDRAKVKEKTCSSRAINDNNATRFGTFEQVDGCCDLSEGYRSMFGVETRDPLGDLRVVEFCFSLPEQQFQQAGVSRSLIRRLMAGLLPPDILAGTKRGLQSADWFERLKQSQGAIKQEVSRLEQSALASKVLDVKRIRSHVDRIPYAAGSPEHTMVDFRYFLESGLMTGRFLRWFETGI
jgi:asparagine synthase (glutamine-hydrolysing)